MPERSASCDPIGRLIELNLAVAISYAPGAEMGRELPWRDRVEPVAVALWARPRFGGKRPSGIDVGRPQRVGRWLRLDDPMLTLRDGRAARGRSAFVVYCRS
jgi:hypothetical protein